MIRLILLYLDYLLRAVDILEVRQQANQDKREARMEKSEEARSQRRIQRRNGVKRIEYKLEALKD